MLEEFPMEKKYLPYRFYFDNLFTGLNLDFFNFKIQHSDKSNKNILYFSDLKNKFEKRKTVNGLFNKTHLNND